MLILVDSAICLRETPRFWRMVARPRTPSSFMDSFASSARSYPGGGTKPRQVRIKRYTIALIGSLINSFHMDICRREFGACILAGLTSRLLALPPRPKLLVLVVIEQLRPDY